MSFLNRTAACAPLLTRTASSHSSSIRHLASQTNPYFKQSDNAPPTKSSTLVYRNVQRGQALGVTGIAGAQACFWAYAAYEASQVAQPLISPMWSVAGLGISATFVALSSFYLRLRVAELTVEHHGAKHTLRVHTHSPLGFLSAPDLVEPSHVKAGPHKDSEKERYWTFAVMNKGNFHYIIDTKHGVVDRPLMSAIARGHPAFKAQLDKFGAADFLERYRTWEHKDKFTSCDEKRIQQQQQQ